MLVAVSVKHLAKRFEAVWFILQLSKAAVLPLPGVTRLSTASCVCAFKPQGTPFACYDLSLSQSLYNLRVCPRVSSARYTMEEEGNQKTSSSAAENNEKPDGLLDVDNGISVGVNINLSKNGNQVKHKLEEVTKESLIDEQACKKLKLDLLESEKSIDASDVKTRSELTSSADSGAYDSFISEGASLLEDGFQISDISDVGELLNSEDSREAAEKSGMAENEACIETIQEDALGADQQVSDEAKQSHREATLKEWLEGLSKFPDLFARLEACQGSQEFRELMKGSKNELKKKWKNKTDGKLRPNYFISLQITNEKIRKAVEKVQETILETERALSSALINPATLHITLMVMHLTEEQLPKAADVLDAVQKKINNFAWLSESIKIEGLGTFRGQVLFGKIVEDEGYKQLEFMKDVVSRCYSEGGMPSTDSRRFNPHLTIMKLWKARKAKVKKIPVECYEELLDLEFGEQPLDQLQLCSMDKQKDESGYYHVEHRVAISKPASQGVGPIYFEKLEKNLDWIAHEPEIDAYPFFGKDFPFSNHHDAEFYINGLKFTTSEQWYMLCKAMFHERYDLALKVLDNANPKAQKRMCSVLPPDRDGRSWDATAKRAMTIGVTAKFTQNKHLAEELLNTGDKIMVEASPTDYRWGIGLNRLDPRVHNRSLWRGENWLGQILMVVREGISEGHLPMSDGNEWKVVWDEHSLPTILGPSEFSEIFGWDESDMPELTPP